MAATARVSLIGVKALEQHFRKASVTMQKEVVTEIQDAARPMLRDMHAATHSRIERHAVRTVSIHRTHDGVQLTGGQGGGLNAALFAGGEFGGRSRKKKAVHGYVFGHGHGFVVKRTTMMFKPHLGHEGYWFWPTIRDWLPKIEQNVTERVTKVLGE